jgi:hypothetical protein
MESNRHREQVYVDGLQGLRGYQDNSFAGYDSILGHIEVRTTPISLASLRVGGLVFTDVGHAADTFQALTEYQATLVLGFAY